MGEMDSGQESRAARGCWALTVPGAGGGGARPRLQGQVKEVCGRAAGAAEGVRPESDGAYSGRRGRKMCSAAAAGQADEACGRAAGAFKGARPKSGGAG